MHIAAVTCRLRTSPKRKHWRSRRQEAAAFNFLRGGTGLRSRDYADGVIRISDAAVLDRSARGARLRVDPSTQEPVGEIEGHGHTPCVPAAILAASRRILSKTFMSWRRHDRRSDSKIRSQR